MVRQMSTGYPTVVLLCSTSTFHCCLSGYVNCNHNGDLHLRENEVNCWWRNALIWSTRWRTTKTLCAGCRQMSLLKEWQNSSTSPARKDTLEMYPTSCLFHEKIPPNIEIIGNVTNKINIKYIGYLLSYIPLSTCYCVTETYVQFCYCVALRCSTWLYVALRGSTWRLISLNIPCVALPKPNTPHEPRHHKLETDVL